jgi:hypothetical protein
MAVPTTMDDARNLLAELTAQHGTDGVLSLLAGVDDRTSNDGSFAA